MKFSTKIGLISYLCTSIFLKLKISQLQLYCECHNILFIIILPMVIIFSKLLYWIPFRDWAQYCVCFMLIIYIGLIVIEVGNLLEYIGIIYSYLNIFHNSIYWKFT
jgi:hypothetical protein